MHPKRVDRPFLIITTILVVVGYLIFSSAALGLIAKSSGQFQAVMFNQVVLGLICGTIAAFVLSKIDYKKWRTWGFWAFIFSAILMLLVFIPHIGISVMGARRWISIAGFSFQPAEFYKIGFVMYIAAWYASVKAKSGTFKFGVLPYVVLVGITGLLVLAQPDTDTFMVIAVAGFAIWFAAGAKWRHILLMLLLGGTLLAGVALTRPYVMQRIQTFIHPAADPTGSGYQIQQSLIAIGSGGLFGRGFGQSIQKFNYLPEPIGDSIFAVASEEFGFVGSISIILLYILFAFQGFRIAIRAEDPFGTYLVLGLIILITVQSLLNISAMLGITPLSGTPLLFISHGGTALFFALASVGIILNVSRYQKKKA